MSKEIERKFLVVGHEWRHGAASRRIRQGYLSLDEHRSVRVRQSGDRGWLTVKGALEGRSRVEFEYPISLADARQLLDILCLEPIIEKTRFLVHHAGRAWEIDVFEGVNEGLVLAEIELEHADAAFESPPWLGPEVTDDPRYYNASLVTHPYQAWPDRQAQASSRESPPPGTSAGADPA